MKRPITVNGWINKETTCWPMNTFATLVKPKSKNRLNKPTFTCKKANTPFYFRWIEDCLQDEIDPIIKLEESMRNGIVLAKLADWFSPGIVRKIFQVQ